MVTIVQFSGGKDSMAALLWTLENITKKPLIVFCDTGFEAAETYKYIDYVEEKLSIPIIKLKVKNTMECLTWLKRKKGFQAQKQGSVLRNLK